MEAQYLSPISSVSPGAMRLQQGAPRGHAFVRRHSRRSRESRPYHERYGLKLLKLSPFWIPAYSENDDKWVWLMRSSLGA